MGILHEDVVIIRHPDREQDPSIITVNCPDKTGLGCDLCRLILFFGLTILRVDVSTDGKWCYIVFWVVGNQNTRWSLLQKRLVGVCPSCSSASGISFYRSEQPPRPPEFFLLTLCCDNRHGLLHDVTLVLCELELSIKRVKVSTTPEGRVVDLFFITDTREQLHTKKRQDETLKRLKDTLGADIFSCDIEPVRPEVVTCSTVSNLPPSIVEDNPETAVVACENVTVTFDNSLSPAHTLVQIECQDHKGLLYDIMRTLKDYNIQISYGRFTKKQRRNCEVDLFIMQADGKKIVDPSKQKALQSRLESELTRPVRVSVVSRGPDTELLVANPVEISGKGRPLVFHDITLALKMLKTGIFSVC